MASNESNGPYLTRAVGDHSRYISPIGVDTIQLCLDDFQIDDRNGLQVTLPPNGRCHSGPLPVTLPSSEVIWGFRGQYYSKRFKLHVGTLPDGRRIATVRLSIPRSYSSKDNFDPVSKEGCLRLFGELAAEMREVGVKCNILQSQVTRLDLFRNIQTSEPFRVYQPVFQVMSAVRVHRDEFAGTGFVLRNTRREWAFYDKRAEMKKRRKDFAGLPPEVARAEYRLLRPDVIERAFGTRCLVELLREPAELAACYREAFGKKVFLHEPPKIGVALVGGTNPLLEFYRELHGRQWPSALYKDRGMIAEIQEFGSVEAAAAWRSPADTRRRNRIEKDLQRTLVKWWAALAATEQTGTKLTELYAELRTAVLAA